MKRTLFLLLVVLLSIGTTSAQQQSMFTKYMFNTLAFNPAYAGSREALSANLLYRNQWMGLDGAPVTQTLGIHSPIKPRVAVGLAIVNDKIGPTSSTGVNAIYAYRIEFGKGKLSVGLQAGALNWRADWDKLRYKDPQSIDDAFSGGNESKWFPNFGAGIYYYSDRFYTGFASPGLLESKLNNETSFDLSARLYRHYYYSIGGAIPISGDMIVFKPSALIKGVNLFASGTKTASTVSSPVEFDIDFGFLFYKTFWIGTAFRSSVEKFTNKSSSYDSADIWTSLQLRNGLRIGAAYDYSLTKLQTVSKGSVEVMLGYDFNYEDAALAHVRYF
ncbi:MAG TPA: type IX secretion system membrane protein PorP/SprF [Saprospiraceae bacterium]|nr:type IX secretion system membrane protein PorP/SprF [Saprospiraceae bacterium]